MNLRNSKHKVRSCCGELRNEEVAGETRRKKTGEMQMKRRAVVKGLGLAGLGATMFGGVAPAGAAGEAGVYELRVYTTY